MDIDQIASPDSHPLHIDDYISCHPLASHTIYSHTHTLTSGMDIDQLVLILTIIPLTMMSVFHVTSFTLITSLIKSTHAGMDIDQIASPGSGISTTPTSYLEGGGGSGVRSRTRASVTGLTHMEYTTPRRITTATSTTTTTGSSSGAGTSAGYGRGTVNGNSTVSFGGSSSSRAGVSHDGGDSTSSGVGVGAVASPGAVAVGYDPVRWANDCLRQGFQATLPSPLPISTQPLPLPTVDSTQTRATFTPGNIYSPEIQYASIGASAGANIGTKGLSGYPHYSQYGDSSSSSSSSIISQSTRKRQWAQEYDYDYETNNNNDNDIGSTHYDGSGYRDTYNGNGFDSSSSSGGVSWPYGTTINPHFHPPTPTSGARKLTRAQMGARDKARAVADRVAFQAFCAEQERGRVPWTQGILHPHHAVAGREEVMGAESRQRQREQQQQPHEYQDSGMVEEGKSSSSSSSNISSGGGNDSNVHGTGSAMLSMLGCVDDEREESDRLEMRLRAAVEGYTHPYHDNTNPYANNNNNSSNGSSSNNNSKSHASISLLPPHALPQSLPNSSLFRIPSYGLGSVPGPGPGPDLTAVTAEELSQRCREENDHFQRLLRMANM